jgi:nucleoside-diphosphate-sugar epimerase
MTTTNPHVFIVGCGDIGQRVAALWLRRGAHVTALARNQARADEYTRLGIATVVGDLDQSGSLSASPAQALVYYFAPPPSRGTSDPRMCNFLRSIDPAALPARIVYISTSGVYGNVHGAWLTEAAPTHPTTDRSRRRLDAELTLQKWSMVNQIPIVTLRVPGIYGPGRLPIDVVKSGRPILREAESMYTNRIHADDLANICVVAGEAQSSPGIYNVSDGHPGTMAQYFKAVADLLGVARPPEVSLEEAQRVLSAEMMSYLTESRRVDNSKMLRELGVKLRYPTLAEGLKSCYDGR